MKTRKLDDHSQKLLNYIAEINPNTSIGRAFAWVDEFQEYRNDLNLANFTIIKLLTLLGVDDSGTLKDKAIATKMLEMDDSIWYAWQTALNIHCGHACGIPSPGFVLNDVPIKLGVSKEMAMSRKTAMQNLFKEKSDE